MNYPTDGLRYEIFDIVCMAVEGRVDATVSLDVVVDATWEHDVDAAVGDGVRAGVVDGVASGVGDAVWDGVLDWAAL